MPASYRSVNYTIRPAKSVERHVLCEAFGELRVFAPLQTYTYVGLGAIYFADFALFHRRLAFQRMICMERQADDQSRFEFNRPYFCIEIQFGESTDLLPRLDWTGSRFIVWMDYDDPISENAVGDACQFARHAQSGSAFLCTLNAEPKQKPKSADPDSTLEEWRLSEFKGRVGAPNVPLGLTGNDLDAKSLPSVCARILEQAMKPVLDDRNIGLAPEESLRLIQFVNLTYQDSTSMVTVGWLIVRQSEARLFQQCRFNELPLRDSDGGALHIRVPNVTLRELHELNRTPPSSRKKRSKSMPVPETEQSLHSRWYRYLPTFSEVEVS